MPITKWCLPLCKDLRAYARVFIVMNTWLTTCARYVEFMRSSGYVFGLFHYVQHSTMLIASVKGGFHGPRCAYLSYYARASLL